MTPLIVIATVLVPIWASSTDFLKFVNPVRPILSACTSHNFQLGKNLIPIISHLASNDYILKNSSDFVSTIQGIPDADSLYICSFDVESLYTSIPVDETIELNLYTIYISADVVHWNLNRNMLRKLLIASLKDCYFKFNNMQQIDGLAMGLPLSPVIANIF